MLLIVVAAHAHLVAGGQVLLEFLELGAGRLEHFGRKHAWPWEAAHRDCPEVIEPDDALGVHRVLDFRDLRERNLR